MGRAQFQYDIAVSFAGEQRNYVEAVVHDLRALGVNVFYDRAERAALWGKDLAEHLELVYSRLARYCVVFASEAYASKVWTNHERRAALARALDDGPEYILPARFDDVEIPGLRPTLGFVDLRTTSPGELAEIIFQKLGREWAGTTETSAREYDPLTAARGYRLLKHDWTMTIDPANVQRETFDYITSIRAFRNERFFQLGIEPDGSIEELDVVSRSRGHVEVGHVPVDVRDSRGRRLVVVYFGRELRPLDVETVHIRLVTVRDGDEPSSGLSCATLSPTEYVRLRVATPRSHVPVYQRLEYEGYDPLAASRRTEVRRRSDKPMEFVVRSPVLGRRYEIAW